LAVPEVVLPVPAVDEVAVDEVVVPLLDPDFFVAVAAVVLVLAAAAWVVVAV
jgi:hypothetical protein